MAGIEAARERWRALWRALGARRVPESAFDELLASYREPQRAYHTFDHVLDCLAQLDRESELAERPAELEAAIWFHDVVYDPSRDDNEARSAERARAVMAAAGVEDDAISRVERLVLATRDHAAPEDAPDARLLLDVDLSILGADRAAFRAYDDAVRAEYAFVPDALFHASRADVLERFLAREPLYLTEAVRSRLESRARANLAAAVEWHREAARRSA